MKTTISALASSLLLIGIPTAAGAASAPDEGPSAADTRRCATVGEVRAVHRGQPKRTVVRILDGHGRSAGRADTRGYRLCYAPGFLHVEFDRAYRNPGAVVVLTRLAIRTNRG